MIYKDGRIVTSYSQLDKYLKCPYSWKLKYIDKIHADIKSKHLEYGLAVHETLEFFFSSLKESSKPSYEEMKILFKSNIERREIPFADKAEELDWSSKGYLMINDIVNAEKEFEKMLVNAEIVGVELPFELPLEIGERTFINPETKEEETHDIVWVIGYIDLLLKTEEGYIVIDHKSGGKKFDKAKLRNDLQFPVYALAVKHIYGEYPVKGYYNFTRIQEVQKVSIAEDVTIEMEEAMNKRGAKEIYCISPENAEMNMKKLFNKIYAKSYNASPTPLCGWCDYGKYNSGICKYSSSYDPSKRKAS